MYGPAPPRRRKTDITRSRGGCVSCRARRKKCDEKKPACSSCVRLGKECQQQPGRLAFRAVTFGGGVAEEDVPLSDAVGETDDHLVDSLPSLESEESFWDVNFSSEGQANKTSFDDDCPGRHEDQVTTPAVAGLDLGLFGFPSSAATSPLPQYQNRTHLLLSPNVDKILSIQVTRQSGQLTFYSNAWETHCIPSLHPALRHLTHFSAMPSPILDAVLALSACRLSRMTPRKKPFDLKGTPGLSFRPDPGHRMASCERYGSALLSLASWGGIADTRGLDVALTGMILLAQLEAMNGDFGQFESHSTAIERLMASLAGTPPGRSTCQLIASWTQARAHNWWRRFHFSTRDYQGNNESMTLSPWLSSVLGVAGDQRAVVMSLLCECCRLRSVAFLARWDEGRVTDVEDLASHVLNTLLPRSPAVDSQRAALDRWHRQLPLSELPIERFMDPPGCSSTFEVRPLQFNTHQAAMNYAYYVVARLLLCEFTTNDEASLCSSDGVTRQANGWALLLARIAAGIDWDDCLRLNVFVIGFSTLLIPCALHCPDLRVGLWLQDWLEQRYTAAALEEGSFPILQGLLALRAINRERRGGRDVRAVFVGDEHGGGATKYDSYSRQHLQSLWVFGRDNETGQQYSRPLAL